MENEHPRKENDNFEDRNLQSMLILTKIYLYVLQLNITTLHKKFLNIPALGLRLDKKFFQTPHETRIYNSRMQARKLLFSFDERKTF